MKFRHILVASDLSEISNMAYRHAASMAKIWDGKITLLNVDEVSHFGFHSSGELNAYLQRVAEIRSLLLANAEEYFSRFGIEIRVEKVSGDPVEVIPQYAQDHNVDLLVMAKRGLRSIKRLILGGTSKRVLRRIHIPTMLVPASIPETGIPSELASYQRILATTDFSQSSKLGLFSTLVLAEQCDAQVEYIHVLRLPIPVPAMPGEAPILVPRESSDQIRHTLTTDLATLVGEAGSKRCLPSVVIGTSVAQTLNETAKNANFDLITIPSHGKSGVEIAFFGSTTENVLKLSSIPVLVFPAAFLAREFA
jgi:nucleotide-binding universal stress UspA family protein